MSKAYRIMCNSTVMGVYTGNLNGLHGAIEQMAAQDYRERLRYWKAHYDRYGKMDGDPYLHYRVVCKWHSEEVDHYEDQDES